MAWYSGIIKAGDAVGNFLVDTVDSLQTALDVLGYVPVVGAIPDIINGGIYALRVRVVVNLQRVRGRS